MNSRPLRHTREKTERAWQLVLVYGSQNERRENSGTVSLAWLRGYPEIVVVLCRIWCRNKSAKVARQTVSLSRMPLNET